MFNDVLGTLILETASSAWSILVALVGCPSQASWVEPRYRARNNTPSMSTERVTSRNKIHC